MTTRSREPLLDVRACGPATESGRIPLQKLLTLGHHVQSAVERVARVLLGQADSRRTGRKPQEISRSCALEVVALNRGSFEIGFDLPRAEFEAVDLGVEAVEKLLEGIESIQTNGEALPAGYDVGVLHTLRDMGRVLGDGIDQIEVRARTPRLRRTFCFTPEVHLRVVERIKAPVRNQRTIEGRLLMADFSHEHEAERCRIHPPVGNAVFCQFDESLEETVYEYLRSYVRVTGETREDPVTGRISSITIRDIEPVSMEGETFEPVSADAFWEERSLEQLAGEQGVQPVRRLEDVWGSGSGLWPDDQDFQAFLAATKGAEREEA